MIANHNNTSYKVTVKILETRRRLNPIKHTTHVGWTAGSFEQPAPQLIRTD